MTDPVQLADAFLETFDKSAAELFRAWLDKRPATTKWVIGGDFALRDKSRPNDCFAFTIIPYELDFRSYQAFIEQNLPRDLKDSRTLRPAASNLLKDGHAFHVLVPINQDRILFLGESESELTVARRCLQLALDQAIAVERGPEAILKARKAVQKSRAKAFNVGLLTDLTILATLLPLLSLIIARERTPKVMGWFCDRDSMSSWCDGLLWNIALENFHGLAEKFGIERGPDPQIGTPDRSGPKEIMWFDHLVRQSDWLAGTLAAWDREENRLPEGSDKYLRVVEDVLADADNLVILPIRMQTDILSVTRLLIEKAAGDGDRRDP